MLNWEKWLGIAVAIVVSLFLAFTAGHFQGKLEASKDAEKAAQKLAEKHRQEIARRDATTLKKEQDHAKEVSDLRTTYAAENARKAAADAVVIAQLRAGERRLRLSVTPGSCAPSAPAAASAAGADAAPRAELDPETGAALYSIVSDGDGAIRQLSALQEYTLKLYNTCNGAPAP